MTMSLKLDVSSFLLILGLATCFSCSSDLDCKSFRTGEFKLGTTSDVRILRTEDLQKEYSNNPDEDFIDVYSIRWPDECTYVATVRETNRPAGHELTVGDSMLIKIIKTSGAKYEWEGHTKGDIKKGIMIKID